MVAFCLFLLFVLLFLKKNQSTPRPSEHPPVMGEKLFLVIHFYFYFFCLFCVPSCMATMSFASYFLVRYLLSAFPAFLQTCFGFRLSCDHGWICSGSVNVK